MMDINLLVDTPLPGRFVIASGGFHWAMVLSVLLGLGRVQGIVPDFHSVDWILSGKPGFHGYHGLVQ